MLSDVVGVELSLRLGLESDVASVRLDRVQLRFARRLVPVEHAPGRFVKHRRTEVLRGELVGAEGDDRDELALLADRADRPGLVGVPLRAVQLSEVVVERTFRPTVFSEILSGEAVGVTANHLAIGERRLIERGASELLARLRVVAGDDDHLAEITLTAGDDDAVLEARGRLGRGRCRLGRSGLRTGRGCTVGRLVGLSLGSLSARGEHDGRNDRGRQQG